MDDLHSLEEFKIKKIQRIPNFGEPVEHEFSSDFEKNDQALANDFKFLEIEMEDARQIENYFDFSRLDVQDKMQFERVNNEHVVVTRWDNDNDGVKKVYDPCYESIFDKDDPDSYVVLFEIPFKDKRPHGIVNLYMAPHDTSQLNGDKWDSVKLAWTYEYDEGSLKVTNEYEDGNLIREEFYNGPHRKFSPYHPGKLIFEGENKDGLLNGYSKYYDPVSGAVTKEGPHVNDQMEGEWIFNDAKDWNFKNPDGGKALVMHKDDFPAGPYFEWDKNDNLVDEGVYHGSRKISHKKVNVVAAPPAPDNVAQSFSENKDFFGLNKLFRKISLRMKSTK